MGSVTMNIDITQTEKDRLVQHFTDSLREEARPNRIVSSGAVIGALEALQILDTVHATLEEGEQ